MCPEPGEQFQVPVDIAGERFGHLLFHFAELLLQFVERFVLLVLPIRFPRGENGCKY